jgi:hypothetical protein
VLRLGGGGGCLLQRKIHKEEVEMGEGERRVKRQVIKLNITDKLKDKIIPMVTPLAIFSV